MRRKKYIFFILFGLFLFLFNQNVNAKSRNLGTITFDKKYFNSCYSYWNEEDYENGHIDYSWKNLNYYGLTPENLPMGVEDLGQYYGPGSIYDSDFNYISESETDDYYELSTSIKVINKKICTLFTDYDYYDDEYTDLVIPKSAGTTYIHCYVKGNRIIKDKIKTYDEYGDPTWDYVERKEKVNDDYYIKVVVKKEFIKAYKNKIAEAQRKRFIKASKINTIYYGDNVITGKAPAGTSVSISIGGKKRKVKANSKGKFTIKKIPLVKIGKTLNLKFSKGKQKWTKSSKVESYNVGIKFNKVYRNSTSIKVATKRVNKGDTLKIKIGNKTYTKKFKKGRSKTSNTISISRPTEGQKIKISLVNKFGQKIDSETGIVYYASKLSIGLTKKQAMLIPGWEKKYRNGIYYYTYDEQWCYDDDGDGYSDSYLNFDSKGRLYGWSY